MRINVNNIQICKEKNKDIVPTNTLCLGSNQNV